MRSKRARLIALSTSFLLLIAHSPAYGKTPKPTIAQIEAAKKAEAEKKKIADAAAAKLSKANLTLKQLTAVANSLNSTAFLFFMVIFFWTPPHFWALAIKYKDDYEAAGIPMLPVVAPIAKVEQQMWFHTIAMFATSYLTLYSAALPAWSYIANTALTTFFAIQMFSLKSSQIEKSAAKIFHGSITCLSLYSILLVAAIFITF